jgi:hypothetical protein
MGSKRSFIPWIKRKCKICGQRIKRYSATSLYCGAACKQQAYRNRLAKRARQLSKRGFQGNSRRVRHLDQEGV